MKKLSAALLVVFATSSLLVLGSGQADQIKKKAKDLKRNIEAGQTNGAKTNTPPQVR